MKVLKLGRKAVVVAAVAFIVSLFVAPGMMAAQVAPPSYELVFCTSTIDPKCQPQNLPILIEAGIISGGGSTAATGATVGVGTTAGSGITGGSMVLGGATLAGGTLGLGLAGTHDWAFTTDPDWIVDGGTTSPDTCYSFDQCASIAGTVTYMGDVVYCLGQDAAPFANSRFVGRWRSPTDTLVERPFNVANFTVECGTSFGGLWIPQVGGGVTTGWVLDAIRATNTSTWAEISSVEDAAVIAGTLTVTVTCRPTGGGADYLVGSATPLEVVSGEDLRPPDAGCLPGDVAVSVGATWAPANGAPEITIVPETFAPTEIVDLPIEYPDCFGPEVAPCALELWKIGLGGAMSYCGSIGQLCTGWAQAPDVTTQYACFYGAYPIDLNHCSAYRNPKVGVLPNVDEDGQLLPVTAPTPAPLPNPVTTVGGALDLGLLPGSVEDPEVSPNECFPTGWGVFNPFSWVYMPVQCALKWAFVPRTQVVQAVGARVAVAWDATSLAQPRQIVSTWAAELPTTGGGSCMGPPVDLTGDALRQWGFDGVYYPLAACTEPLATIAAVTKVVVSGGVVLAACYAIVRYLAATFDYIGIGKEGSAG